MERIDLIVDLVNDNKIVADIGADHGKTSLEIVAKKNPKMVIATDISSKSLQKLVDKLKGKSYPIKTVVTDGIKDLEAYGIEEIIISGMGGFLISRILEEGRNVASKAEKLILQANNSLDHLRRYLIGNSYAICDERVCFEGGIFYRIIVAKKVLYIDENYDDLAFKYGYIPFKNKDPLFRAELVRELDVLQNLYNNLENKDGARIESRRKELEDKIKEIEGLVKCL